MKPVLTRQHYALLTLGAMLFTLYGSFVPFRLEPRPLGEALGAFRWVWEHRLAVESRSDALANLLLGVPLGFGAMATLRVDRAWSRRAALVTLAWLWPVCSLFAVGVEFGQLYFPGRTCSATDILAQSTGSLLGMLGWLLIGPWLTFHLRQIADHPRLGGPVGRFLLLYSALVCLVEWLPLDIVTSPVAVYHQIQHDWNNGRITKVLFEEWSRPDRWGKVQTWLQLFSLFLPVGLILAHGRWNWLVTILFGITLATVGEVGQFFVSRHPSVTDVFIGSFGVITGALAVRIGRVTWAKILICGQLWFAVMAVAHWQPFDFQAAHSVRIILVPFADVDARQTLGSLNEWLERLMMFLPWGVLTGAILAREPRAKRLGFAAGVGFSVACVLEIGQVFLPDRLVTTTALLSGAFGAALGAWATDAIFTARETS